MGNPEITVKPDISEQVLSLATTELRRMETENSFWLGAYSGMSLVDGDTTSLRIRGVYEAHNTITRDFPKAHWIVYLQHSIPRFGHSTIMAFSKKSLALVYFGSAYDEERDSVQINH
jgi:hypothetical protein